MSLTGIDHFVIVAGDIEKTIRFYTEVLGMAHTVKDGHHGLSFPGGRISLHAKKGEFLPCAARPEIGSCDFCLRSDRPIAEVKAELEKRGAKIELGPAARTGALGAMKSVYLRDPDGNLVEICSYA
ncbi:MAG: VOC family protein [Burkholderia sp.]|jgi:catechol 2,3-dioxygenase-like lactoylglutathione lyase family enzyme